MTETATISGLRQRIIDISKELKLSHIGSNLSCLPVLEEIYTKRKEGDLVILDNAHAHLAHIVVIQKLGMINTDWQIYPPNDRFPDLSATEIIKKYGIHCDYQAGCDASGGSLGHALGIGIGRALADPKRMVYVIVSDGSMMEGSNWEALRLIHKFNLKNIKIYCNFNGHTAVDDINTGILEHRMRQFVHNIEVRNTDNTEGFEGVQGHYKVL